MINFYIISIFSKIEIILSIILIVKMGNAIQMAMIQGELYNIDGDNSSNSNDSDKIVTVSTQPKKIAQNVNEKQMISNSAEDEVINERIQLKNWVEFANAW